MALKELEKDSSSPNGKLPFAFSRSVISKIWALLESLSKVELFSLSTGQKGRGVVSSYLERENQLVLQETGGWEGKTPVIPYYNSLRFTRRPSFLSLEHLRFGKEYPVFLFDLIPRTEKVCIGRTPHVCGEDLYYGSLELQGKKLLLIFDLKGPKKDERICFTYQ